MPAEVTVVAGERVDFKANLFDAKGQFIRTTPIELKLAAMKPGPGLGKDAIRPVLKGEIDGGSFTAPKISGGQSGSLVATAGDLEASVRVRQVPNQGDTQ